MPPHPKAQSTVEYLILVGSVIFILFLFLSPGGPFHKSFESAINKNMNRMADASQTIFPLGVTPSK